MWLTRSHFEVTPQIYRNKLIIQLSRLKSKRLGFPGGAVVGNLPANAGHTGSSPGLGGSHLPQSNWAREPQLLSLRVWSLCSATREAVIVRGLRTAMKSGPHLPQLERALAQKRRPNTAINKKFKKKKKKSKRFVGMGILEGLLYILYRITKEIRSNLAN